MEKYQKFKIHRSIFMLNKCQPPDIMFTIIDEKQQARHFAKCHQEKLSACANFFRFLKSSQQCRKLGYFFKATSNINIDSVYLLLQTCYGVLEIDDLIQAVNLCKISSKFEFSSGVIESVKFAQANMTPTDVWTLLKIPATDAVHLDALVEAAYQYAEENTSQCLKSKEFLACSQPNLSKLTASDRLHLENGEIELIKAVIAWAKVRVPEMTPKAARRVLRECLTNLRFLCLNIKEFCEHVQQENIMSHEEICTIYLYILKPETEKPSRPPMFSTLRSPRLSEVKDHTQKVVKLQSTGSQTSVDIRINQQNKEHKATQTEIEKQPSDNNEAMLVKDIRTKVLQEKREIEGPCEIVIGLRVPQMAKVDSVIVNCPVPLGYSLGKYLEAAEVVIFKQGQEKDINKITWGSILDRVFYGGKFKIPMSLSVHLESNTDYLIKLSLKVKGLYPSSKVITLAEERGEKILHFKADCINPIESIILNYNSK